MSELVERLELVWVQNLRSFIRGQVGFGDEWRDIFVERLEATVADNMHLQEALAAAEAERDEAKRLLDIQIAGHRLSAKDATTNLIRACAAEATLLLTPMAERVAELPDFMAALSEWGCVDPNEQADAITKFLNSTVGLREYLEDQSKAGGRDGH